MSQKIAAIQMCSSNNIEQNLNTVQKYIAEAARNGAKLVVLSEMFAIIGLTPKDKMQHKENFGDGPIQNFLSQQAQLHKMWIVGGTIPIACDDANKIRAACLVFNAEGKIVARYDKIHLFDVVLSNTEKYQESDTIEPGNEPVIIDTPFGKLGLAVCYDIRFPELFRYYADKGAEIFIIPTAFTVKTGPHWDILTRARAIENFCYVVGACQGGHHVGGRKTYGHSVIINPWGDVIAEMKNDDSGIIYADITLDHLHQVRASIPALTHRKKL